MSTFMDHIHRTQPAPLLAEPKVGDRVEVPAYTDDWMRGDRFGTVTGEHKANAYFLPEWVSVALDKSGCNHRFIANDCKVVES